MAHTDHPRPSKCWGTVWKRQKTYEAQTTRRYKRRREGLDMGEQLRDLNSERDWYVLNTVGVHLRTRTQSNVFTVDLAEWEIALLGDLARVYYAPVLMHSTRSQAYEVGFDAYFLDRAHEATRVRVEPVIENKPVTAWERQRAEEAARKQARKERKRKEALEARKRTLTDEQRREILRRESVGARGFSRV